MSDVQPNDIEKLLLQLIEVKDKLENAKAVLKQYKVKSPQLDALKQAKKELTQQINDEVDRIEGDYYEDKTYETAKNDELTHKNEIKEKSTELREMMNRVNTDQQLSTYDYNIKGSPVKMQVERTVKVYLNGKEEK